ncbi:Uma2 family endonuclease [Nonomuraea indica]|uniref:Uma2 family endonuclease n=1 Tax=Nonomuraea indica TaxID=1581193 RepID=UPI000C7B663F|nr:Uma2 family endonuclease [Nonomuraea indica]
MAKVLERPTVESTCAPTPEEQYRAVCEVLPDRRVELIDERIVVREVPTGAHNDVIALLLFQITRVLMDNDWRPWTNIKLFLGAQQGLLVPDLVIVPRKRRMWGNDAVHGDNTLLVVEVVSPSSVHDDYTFKPGAYALAGVPLFLRVDPLKNLVSLMSHPCDDRGTYLHHTEVAVGEPLDLPEPWKLTLDTGKLVDE